MTRFEIFGGANAITYHGGGGGIIEAGLSTNTVGIDNVAAVPEPSTLGLLVAGCGAAAVMRRRRFSAATS